ncbi:MAG TPA: cytochrome c [Pirellulales bacterium]|nr:cytochrome c [Pirellulales bacterium]
MSKLLRSVLLVSLACQLLVAQPGASAAGKAKGGKRKLYPTAPPPKWNEKVVGAFFTDARDKLGPGQPGAQAAAAGPAADSDDGGVAEATKTGGGFAWSKLISAATIEDLVKAQVAPLAEQTKTPSVFKGGGNHHARVNFSLVAMLFAVIQQFDGDIRSSWKKDAVGLRAMFGRAGVNCKVGTDNSFKEAKTRSEELAELVKGSKIEVPKAEPEFKWAELVNRPPLMTRMGKEGYNVAAKNWTSDKGEFTKNKDDLLREAQLLAVIGHVIQHESYEFGDDEGYVNLAKELEQQAIDLAEAVKAGDLQRAQSAAGKVNKACSACHEGYRSGG